MTGNSILFFDRRVRRIAFYAVDAVQACLQAVVRLSAGSDDLSVGRAQAEAMTAGFIKIDLELRMLDLLITLLSRVFNPGNRRVFLHAGDARAAGFLGFVDLGSGNRLAIACLQVEVELTIRSNFQFEFGGHF